MKRYVIVTLLLCVWGGIGFGETDIAELQRKAEQGLSEAQFELALAYSEGKGIPKDDKKALEWTTKAAEQGLAEAQCSLGVVYTIGTGVPKDDKKAFEWFSKAAKQGLAFAQGRLAVMYYEGRGTVQDYKKAYAWVSLAASSGDKDSVKTRDLLSEELTQEALREAQALAAHLSDKVQKNRAAVAAKKK